MDHVIGLLLGDKGKTFIENYREWEKRNGESIDRSSKRTNERVNERVRDSVDVELILIVSQFKRSARNTHTRYTFQASSHWLME